jgi:hypothetical protein
MGELAHALHPWPRKFGTSRSQGKQSICSEFQQFHCHIHRIQLPDEHHHPLKKGWCWDWGSNQKKDHNYQHLQTQRTTEEEVLAIEQRLELDPELVGEWKAAR